MNELSPPQYYNQISANYDSILSASEMNKNVREVILSYFIKHVSGNKVLDFGGGTGLDLQWLVKAGYEVQFCEPSKGMMQKAKQLWLDNSLNIRVNFWNTQESDFT